MSVNECDLTDIWICRSIGLPMMPPHLHDFQLNFSATFHICTQHADGTHTHTIGIQSKFGAWVLVAAIKNTITSFSKCNARTCWRLLSSLLYYIFQEKKNNHTRSEIGPIAYSITAQASDSIFFLAVERCAGRWQRIQIIRIFKSFYKRRTQHFDAPHIIGAAQRIQVSEAKECVENCFNGN